MRKIQLMASSAVAAIAAARFADFQSNETPAKTKPVSRVSSASNSIKTNRRISTFTLAAQAPGDRLMLPAIPKGARGVQFRIQSSVALGAAATIAIGVAGNTGKYRAAAIKNDTAIEHVASAVNTAAELAADEAPFITVAAAALPGAGTLTVETIYNT